MNSVTKDQLVFGLGGAAVAFFVSGRFKIAGCTALVGAVAHRVLKSVPAAPQVEGAGGMEKECHQQ